MKKVVSLETHDLELHRAGLDEFVKLKEHLPNLKVTFFTVPIPRALTSKVATVEDYQEWADWLRNQDWIEICPHGMTHSGFEMKHLPGKKKLVDYDTANSYIDVAEHTFQQLNLPFKKIWASPFWETSPEAYKALWDRGYTVAVDPNQEIPEGGPVYTYNWSIDKPFPAEEKVVKGHGHMYPPSANAIQSCLENVLSIPQDYEFKFVSELNG